MLDNGSLNISGDAIALLCVSFTRHGANGLVFDFRTSVNVTSSPELSRKLWSSFGKASSIASARV